MSTQTIEGTQMAVVHRAGFGHTLRAEWAKLWSVRSTWWTMAALVLLGAGLTTLLCWGNAEWLAGEDADESPGSFITWGMMLAQVCAVIVGTVCTTRGSSSQARSFSSWFIAW